MAASSFFVYQGIYLATSRGPALISLMSGAGNQALAQHPSGVIATPTRCSRPRCVTREGNVPSLWGLLGVGVLLVVADVIFLAQPWWYRRRRRLTELTGPAPRTW